MSEVERQRFSSWKEIAKFLNCCGKTARRWELQRHLPVRRVPGGAKRSVYAFRDELEKWLEGNQINDSCLDLPPPPHTRTRTYTTSTHRRIETTSAGGRIDGRSVRIASTAFF